MPRRCIWSAPLRPGAGLVLGQRATAEKSNEKTAIPELLATLALEGCIVTIDAMGTQANIAQAIRDRGADYVLAVKDNQPTWPIRCGTSLPIQGTPHAPRTRWPKRREGSWPTGNPPLLRLRSTGLPGQTRAMARSEILRGDRVRTLYQRQDLD
jgi:hypothetical protein